MSNDSWLSSLSNHAIFTLPSNEGEAESSSSSSSSAAKRNTMVVRGGDLIVAVGKEVRMCNLGDVKSGGRAGYKTLNTPNLTFPILSLIPNPTGKLLAVVGAHQLVVLVLPRPGYINLVAPLIECRSIPIGAYHHSPSTSSTPSLTKVLWHPWGQNASSLLVLTLDGLLREYDPLQDAEEPQQLVSVVPPREGGSRWMSAEEPGERDAVSFCLGRGEGDWGALSVYALMGNGDIYGVCPFLPKNALVPEAYIRSLSAFASSKLSYISTLPAPSPSQSHSPVRTTPAPSFLSTRYQAQTAFLSSLLSQISDVTSSNPTSMEVDDSSEPVLVHPPTSAGSRKPLVQGPFLFQPAPRELDGDDVPRATDIFLLGAGGGVRGSRNDEEEEGGGDKVGRKSEMTVLGLVFEDGKVDLCLEVEKMEGLWVGRQETVQSNPALAVYETIDLNILPSIESSSSSLDIDPTVLVDPLYDDTIYIYHAFGVHCIVLRKWMDALSEALAITDEEKRDIELDRFFGRGIQSEVVMVVDTRSESDGTSAPIHSVAIISDVYLSYSLLALTSSLQQVGLELSLRVDSPPSPSLSPAKLPSSLPPTPSASSSSTSHYISLLGVEPFTIPPILADRSGLPTKPRVVLPQSNGKPLESISPENLRFLGKTVQSFRSDIRDTLSAGSTVQARLDLQLKELERQLSKLASVSDMVSDLRDGEVGGKEGLRNRVERVMETQSALIGRVDKVLQKLMDNHQPILSDYEQKWFGELGRMKEEVGLQVERAVEGGGLKARTALLENHLQILRPKLEELARNDADRAQEKKKQSAALGKHQLARLEQQLAAESKLIASVTKKLDDLSVKADSLK
ncbi:hypothetical protein BDY24DRAFT_366825 [Mrakia frigida]|uniref:linker nucleoporin NUP82 n=1 Tax=Mrakia frigida TaxID=29902 RepID=UPI003FCC0D77